jgi:hypothetical protein
MTDEYNLGARFDGDELAREAQASALVIIPVIVRREHLILRGREHRLARLKLERRFADDRENPCAGAGLPQEGARAERGE